MSDRRKDVDLDAERSVLGACLRLNAVIDDVAIRISADDLATDAHQRLFRAIVAMRTEGKPVDLVTLADRLRARGEVDDVGYPYLAELWDAAPSAANAEYYAGIIRDLSVCRRLAGIGAQLARDAADRVAPSEQLLEQAEQRILEISQLGATGQTEGLDTLVPDAYARYDARATRHMDACGLPTGLIDLDGKTGGLWPSELTILAARTSLGKTSLALCIAYHLAVDLRLPTLMISLEQTKEEVTDRLLCAASGVNHIQLRKAMLGDEDLERFQVAGERLHSSPLLIDDTPSQSMLRIASNARRQRLRRGVRLLIVDYIQLIEPADRKAPRQEQVAAVSRRLKILARELGIPVLALAQVNRAPENRSDDRPRLSDLRESGSLEMDADAVFFLHRPRQDKEPGEQAPGVVQPIDLIIAKQRNGPTGEIMIGFRAECMRFENYEPDAPL